MLLLAFVCLAGALVLAGGALTQPARERQASLRRAMSYGGSRSGDDGGASWSTAASRQSSRLAHLATRIDPRATTDRVGHRLVSAGLARTISPQGFLATKVVLGAAGAVLGGLVLVLSVGGARGLLLLCGLALLGFFGPDLYVNRRAGSRREQLRRELPDALDILAVSVEAGLGFDAALARLGDHMRGPLVEEFTLTLNEMRVGESRQNALKKMAQRVDVPEFHTFVQAILHADHLGSPLGRVLRVQADEARKRRQVAAEERAMKAPVKMLIPILLFIFPAMFVVILGPAVSAIFKAF
jgi:tight adherence protein C